MNMPEHATDAQIHELTDESFAAGRRDYERSLANQPRYPDGTLRKAWHELHSIEQWSWARPVRSE